MTSIDQYLLALERKKRKLRCPQYDIRVCVSPNWHRKYWYYAGNQRYVCEICKRIKVA